MLDAGLEHLHRVGITWIGRTDLPTAEMLGGIEKRPLVLEDYDPQWLEAYAKHERRIRQALGPAAVQIEHIGSTSVPGLACALIPRTVSSTTAPSVS